MMTPRTDKQHCNPGCVNYDSIVYVFDVDLKTLRVFNIVVLLFAALLLFIVINTQRTVL